MNALALSSTPAIEIIVEDRPRVDIRWLEFFDPAAAWRGVLDYVEALPSSRHERHTMRAYTLSLAAFLRYAGAGVIHYGGEHFQIDFCTMAMPNRDMMQAYIGHLKREGKSSKTVMRYMAPVRLFVNALENQTVDIRSGADMAFVMEAQRQFRLAAATKNPKPDVTSHRPALEQYGTRLSFAQVNRLLEWFLPRMDRLDARRDLALIYLGINSGLRAAEIARLRLADIEEGGKCRLMKVRGKRNNVDPVPLDETGYGLLLDWIACWNERLMPDDPRRITPQIPIFQPLVKGNSIPRLGWIGWHPSRGLSEAAILKLVSRVARNSIGVALRTHDLRRTCAKLMRDNQFEWDDIRALLRHNSIATTEKYVGRELDLSRSLLSNRLDFDVPRVPIQQSLA